MSFIVTLFKQLTHHVILTFIDVRFG